MNSTARRAGLAALSLLLLAAALLGVWRVGKTPCWQLTGDLVCRVDTSERVVALSFDDGPTPEGVAAVLPVLEARGVKATFFLIGKHMARHPAEAARLKAAGHELGNHTWTHRRMIGRSSATYDREIADTNRLLRAAGEVAPTLIRPPFGQRLWGFPAAADRAGLLTVTWDVADRVEGFPNPRAYADDILARVRPGSIILMHPMYRHNATERAALPLVLDGLAARGYRVVTVSELLALR